MSCCQSAKIKLQIDECKVTRAHLHLVNFTCGACIQGTAMLCCCGPFPRSPHPSSSSPVSHPTTVTHNCRSSPDYRVAHSRWPIQIQLHIHRCLIQARLQAGMKHSSISALSAIVVMPIRTAHAQVPATAPRQAHSPGCRTAFRGA